jgi:hypothetical protein
MLLSIFGADGASAATSGAAAASSISLAGATLTTTKLVTAGGIAAVALCAILYCSGPDVRPSTPFVATSEAAKELEDSAAIAAAPSPARESVGLAGEAEPVPQAPAAETGAGPFEFDLTILPIDGWERPVSQAEVRIAPELQRLALLGKTEWNGVLHAKWRGFEPALDLVLEVRRSGVGVSTLRRIRIVAGRPETITIAIDNASHRLVSIESAVAGLAERPRDEGSDDGAARFTHDEAGNGVIVDPWFLVGGPAPKRPETTLNGLRFSATLGSVERGEVRAIGVGPKTDSDLSVLVLDEDGRPVPRVMVSLFAETGAFGTGALTDEEGRASLGSPSGLALVVAGGIDRAVARKDLHLEPGEARVLALQCPRLEPTRVRLVDGQGNPLAGWHLEGRRQDANEILTGRADTDQHGRASLQLPLGATGRLYVRPFASAVAPKLLIESQGFVRGSENEIVLRTNDKPGSFDCVIHSQGSDLAKRCEVRLWNVGSQEGRRVRFISSSEQGDAVTSALFRAGDVMPGQYMIEYGAPGLSWKKIGPLYVENGQHLDAGIFRLEEPAHVAVDVASGTTCAVTVRARSNGFLLWSPPVKVSAKSVLDLVSGEWTLSTAIEEAGIVRDPALRTIQAAPGQRIEALAPAAAAPR